MEIICFIHNGEKEREREREREGERREEERGREMVMMHDFIYLLLSLATYKDIVSWSLSSVLEKIVQYINNNIYF